MTIQESSPDISKHAAVPIDLDSIFGMLIEPQSNKIEKVEREIFPRSLTKLDKDSASLLHTLIDATEKGLLVSQYVYNDLPILWIVDSIGDVYFAIEEVVCAKTHQFKFARTGSIKELPKDSVRLGHPALIGAKPGRIGGEIIYDTGSKFPAWYITNKSGRYGVLGGRTETHLQNVADTFKKYGIVFKLQFYCPA